MRSRTIFFVFALALSALLRATDPTPLIRGRFDLLDAKSGQPATQDTYQGKYRLVFFGFTHCPLTCPLGLNTLDKILVNLGKDASKVQALFITVDPARDNAKVMTAYLENHDPRVLGLVGSPKAIAVAMHDFRLEAERMGKGDDYLLEHPAIIYVMGKQGQYLRTVPSSGDLGKIVKDVRAAMKN